MKATHQTLTTPAPDLDPMRPSVLLRGAAVYLGTHGWTQHQFYDLLADTAGPFPPACASGAIMTAATGQCLANGICTLDSNGDDTDTITAMRAMRYFADWFNGAEGPFDAYDGLPPSAIDVIGDWNDDPDRTLAEVIETLTDAANDWDRAHPTGGAQ